MAPLFTIATISYNSAAYIRQTIESVLSSSFADFEFIISDDCSADNTWQIINEYNDPRITATRNEQNIGEYNNRNLVLQRATGRYIFYIDGDDLLFADTLQRLSNYLSFFGDAGMIWGVPAGKIDFAVLPYLFAQEEITRLIFFTQLPLSYLGLGETVFNVEALRSIGGFNTSYSIGDTFVKTLLATRTNVLLVPEGLSFWRRSPNQASQRAQHNYRSFIDMQRINKEVSEDQQFPLSEIERSVVIRNNKISQVKLLVSNTLLRGKFEDFFRLRTKLNINWDDLMLLFSKGTYNYSPVKDVSQPLINGYHLSYKAKEVKALASNE